MFESVLLPAPFSPSSACTSPAAASKSTWSFATTPGNRFVIPRIETAGGAPSAPLPSFVFVPISALSDGALVPRPVMVSRFWRQHEVARQGRREARYGVISGRPRTPHGGLVLRQKRTVYCRMRH